MQILKMSVLMEFHDCFHKSAQNMIQDTFIFKLIEVSKPKIR